MRQLRAGQQIVLPRALVEVRRQDGISVEIPVALHAGGAVGVAGAQAQRRPVGQLHADVPALQRVRVVVVRTLTHGVELVAEQVVVEAAIGAGERCISVRRAQVSAVRAETQFGNGRAAGAGKDLHHAGHGVGAVERALRAANELQTVRSGQGKHAEVEDSAGIVDGNTVHNHFVVGGLAAAHEQETTARRVARLCSPPRREENAEHHRPPPGA